jgi:hypothetical protein
MAGRRRWGPPHHRDGRGRAANRDHRERDLLPRGLPVRDLPRRRSRAGRAGAEAGLVNSWFLVGSVTSLLTTLYGQILLGKLALFAAMLALAAANRFWLVPRMIKTEDSGAPAVCLGRLRYHVLGEQFLGLMVLLAVAVFGTLRPALSQ